MISFSSVLFRSLIRNKNLFAFGESMLKLRRQKEAQLAAKIKKGLQTTYVSVTDTTIGTSSCGQMYNIVVQSPVFQGKSRVQQQMMVNQVISQQIKNIHGYSLKTKIPKKVEPQPSKTDAKSQNADNKDQQKKTQQKETAKKQ